MLQRLVKERQRADLSQFLSFAEGMPGVFSMAMARYFFHSLLYNVSKKIRDENSKVLPLGSVMASAYMLLHGVYGKDKEGEMDPETQEEISKFSRVMMNQVDAMFKSFVSEQYASAMSYKQVAEIEEPPEFFDLFRWEENL